MRHVASAIVRSATCLLFLQGVAAAQGGNSGAIAGVARDKSGGALPGVAVEASSPVLIEKVRATTTDGQGQYAITELRPGTYTVTFTLSGFSTLRREALDLPPNFTATVNAELAVGGIEETVTVTGQSPLVDVRNVTSGKAISNELVDTVPTSKSMNAILALLPGAIGSADAQDVGGTKGEQGIRISVHGVKTTDQRQQLDGMLFSTLPTEGSGRLYFVNSLAVEETVIDLGTNGSAQYSLGGTVVNSIPKDGGNRFSATMFGAWTDHHLQANNLTSELRDQGLTTVNGIRNIYDGNAVLGGPVLKDKLWFVTAHRLNGSTTRVANLFHDANPNDFLFTPDHGRPVQPVERTHSHLTRLTSQASARDKIAGVFDIQRHRRDQPTGTLDRGTTAAEANAAQCILDVLMQASWTRPHTSKLLFEAGVTHYRGSFAPSWGEDTFLSDWNNCGFSDPDKVSINDTGLGFTYNGLGIRSVGKSRQMNGRFNTSYITGQHSFKTGVYFYMDTLNNSYSLRSPLDINRLPLSYTFNNGTPTSVTEFVSPSYVQQKLRPDLGLFVQDQWRLSRLTLNMGLRFDYVRAYVPPVSRPAGLLVDAAEFDGTHCTPCWKDLNPRLGVAYDLFGNGKTAVKAGINRYVQAVTTGISSMFQPASATVASTARAWNDATFGAGDPRTGNFFPDCDLRNPLANDECAQMANLTFGQEVTTIRPDPAWITGWGKRPYSWQASVGVDHQILSNVAVSAGFYRTWFGNFTVTDNLDVTPADFSPYCVTAPVDPRLPGDISGQQICGLYDINQNKFGIASNNVVTLASNFGKQTEIYQGADVNFNARLPRGASLSGGWNIGNSIITSAVFGGAVSSATNRCFVVDSPQQLFRCDVDNPYQGRLKINGSYPLVWHLQIAAVYQDLPGINYGANASFPVAAIQPTLGRQLSGGVRNVTVDLLPPFSVFGDRVHQLDLRLTRFVRLGGTRRLQANFDLYNIMGAATVVGFQNTYTLSGTNRWQQPTQVLDGRLAKFSVQVDF